MTCEISQALLHGYLDGELDPLRAQEFERHLESCSPCIAQLEEQESLRASLRAAKLYEPAPVGLAKKIERQIASTKLESDYQWTWVPIFRWIAASAAIVLLIAITYKGAELILSGRSSAVEQAALSEAIDAHIRSLQPGHLTDVASTDQHTVKPWFNGKLNYVPPVRDFADNGFPLIGGRLDVLNGRSVAVLVYGRRKHLINVFVWPESPNDSAISPTGTRNGYQWNYLRAHGMEFCAVSDVSAADLHDLSELLQE
ncbi:MAG TPA: anti-sigma factor [Candidatus Bathyarchaeia archaeon]|nr:anti-sigma factor [Candidatus Bathyarchaeia archaeon]